MVIKSSPKKGQTELVVELPVCLRILSTSPRFPMEARTSFETLTIKLKFGHKYYILSTIYKTSYSTRHPIPTSTFLIELPDHLNELHRKTEEPIFPGDIIIPWNNQDNLDTIRMVEFPTIQNMEQLVNLPTNIHGNTIDWSCAKPHPILVTSPT